MVSTRVQPDRNDPAVAGVVFPEHALRDMARWAQQRPHAPALLHKVHGRWRVFHWSDAAQAVMDLRLALELQGLGPQARLVVSGALEPRLLLLALAAHVAGATVFAIDRHAQGAALQALLKAAAPTHAFVQERKTLSAWLESGHASAVPVLLYSAQSVAHDSGSWHILPLTQLAGPITGSATSRLRGQAVLWVDEGTEWVEGLEQTLAAWLQSGATLTAPEVSAAATRDRQEVQPQRLLMSSARQQRLQAELHARLAPPGSWQGWLGKRAVRQGGGVLFAWLRHRIARLHGLPAQQLADGAVIPATGEALV